MGGEAMDFLSVQTVAEILGYSEQHVRLLIRTGKLDGEKIGKQWFLPSHVLESGAPYNESSFKKVLDHFNSLTPLPAVRALSFFSGAMGMDIGLQKAGLSILLASEIDLATRKTIQENHPECALIGDIRDYSAGAIREAAGLRPSDDIDLVVGGPPCQAFSTAGKRQGFEDERGNVFLTFVQRILELRPKYAVIENVRGLLSAPLTHRPHDRRGFGFPPLTPEEEKGGALAHILQLLQEGGYSTSFNLYNAANYGAPQVRERVIIICSRDGKKAPYLPPTHSEKGDYGLPKWRSLREALKGLRIRNHDFVRFPEHRLRYYRMLKAGQNWRNLPEDVQKEAMGASWYAGGGKTGFYRRLAWDKPAPTLVTHPAMPATDLGHPVEDRPLSIQEYMRIQEFPDDYKICGSLTDKYRQVGKCRPCESGVRSRKNCARPSQRCGNQNDTGLPLFKVPGHR